MCSGQYTICHNAPPKLYLLQHHQSGMAFPLEAKPANEEVNGTKVDAIRSCEANIGIPTDP